jgi:hypothetical protein
VKQLFAAYLDGLVPSEENRRSMQFLVPRAYQQQLVGLLQQLEAATATGSSGTSVVAGSSVAAVEVVGEEGVRAMRQGVADVQLCLTSLEEVFLSIAKKVSVRCQRAVHAQGRIEGIFKGNTYSGHVPSQVRNVDHVCRNYTALSASVWLSPCAS